MTATPDNRFVSHSMAKSIVSIAVGMALAEKKIASLDDTIAKYVPELAGSPYGETTIRNMLRMASGVPFREAMTARTIWPASADARITQDRSRPCACSRRAKSEQGTRFHYASSQTVVADGVAARGDRHAR